MIWIISHGILILLKLFDVWFTIWFSNVVDFMCQFKTDRLKDLLLRVLLSGKLSKANVITNSKTIKNERINLSMLAGILQEKMFLIVHMTL